MTLRPQYHFRRVNGHLYAWNVGKLVAASAELEVVQVALSEIGEIDEAYWYGDEGDRPTCRSVLGHAQLIAAADLAYPIILCADGRIMDGMHRVLKALGEGHETIAARRLPVTPPPDHIDVAADDLDY